ncbi:hypothetical protein [uncultured Polaribacter sp.]|uniref:hypothetical protein n=1 Tax=uncultured Polaribacter sp. TaxID=174711 RepID=UPI002624ECE1|nr:hypothetical protein [uncultured Polaribacter sp.]
MSNNLGNVFVRSIVREVGRNYGKSISNGLMGNSHSTPIRVVGGLGAGTGGRNYKNKLEKICKTWEIKGPTATFNVAQNIYKAFFDLVDEAQSDNVVDVNETLELMKSFIDARKQLFKIIDALKQLGKEDLAKKVDELDDSIFEFFIELDEGFVLPERPTGLFSGKKKKLWDVYKVVKDNLHKWTEAYKNAQD